MFLNIKDKVFLVDHPKRTQREVVVDGFLSGISGDWCLLSVGGTPSRCRIGMLKRSVPLPVETLCEIKTTKDRVQVVIDNASFDDKVGHYYLTILLAIKWACDFELVESAKYPNGVTMATRIPVSQSQLGEALVNALKGEWEEKLKCLFSISKATEYPLYLHLYVFKNSSEILDYISTSLSFKC